MSPVFLVISGCIVTITAVAALVVYFVRHPVERTPLEVAVIIESFVDGTLDYRRWDDFVCLRIKDDELNAIRLRSWNLSREFPSEDGSYCNEQGWEVLRDYARKLRSIDSDS